MILRIDENTDCAETEIIIRCQKVDSDILRLAAFLRVADKKLTGQKNGEIFLLDAGDVLYIDTVDKRTFFYTVTDIYETPLRLYELEERLMPLDFYRAGKSTIINLRRIQSLSPDMGGRLIVTMENRERLNISRQYAAAIKARIGL